MCTQTYERRFIDEADDRQILELIVEAMLDVKDELLRAQPDEWQRLLSQSCRRRKSRCGQVVREALVAV